MIRGVALDGGYLLPDAEGAQAVTIAPEYCYVETGEVDEDGNAIKEVQDNKDIILFLQKLYSFIKINLHRPHLCAEIPPGL